MSSNAIHTGVFSVHMKCMSTVSVSSLLTVCNYFLDCGKEGNRSPHSPIKSKVAPSQKSWLERRRRIEKRRRRTKDQEEPVERRKEGEGRSLLPEASWSGREEREGREKSDWPPPVAVYTWYCTSFLTL